MNIILSEIRPDGSESPEQTYSTSVLRVGRDPFECDIAFPRDAFPMVSRKHAELRWDDSKWYLVDLGASYGTYLDGRRISTPERIHAGQTLQFGADGPKLKVVWFEVLVDSLAPVPSESTSDEPPKQIPVPAAAIPPPAARPNPFDSPPPSHRPSPVAVPIADSGAKLAFVEEPGRQAFPLANQGISFGRDPSCDISFGATANMVSRKHAMLRREGDAYIIEDNGSFNGTYVNDQRISAPTPLYHQDMLRFGIGGPVLEFVWPVRPAPAASAGAGQRSVAFPNIAEAFHLNDAIGSKTMAIKMDRLPSTGKAQLGEQPQLLMSLTFGEKKELSVGRDPKNDITLDGLQISSRHARLLSTASGIFIDDLGSTNGVYVNGDRVSRSQLTPSDKVLIGSFELRIDAAGNVGVFDTRSRTRVDAVDLVREVRSRGETLRLLDGVSLSIQPNEFVGILGPSGAGKSTLIEAMNGMRPASSGNVLVNNLDLYRHLDSLKQAIGYVPQDDIIHRELTVYRTLYYVAKLRLSRDVSSVEIDQTINEVLDVTGLAERRDVQVSKLSGGQRKRVSIAVELITKPSIIFLDEPTSGLDPATEERIMRLFRQIAESGRTVILTTHAMENVGLFDKIVVLMRGKLVFYGKPQDALKHLGASSYKQLFEKLEEPVEQAVVEQGESVRRQLQERTAEDWKHRFVKSPQYRQYVHEPLKQLGTLPASGVAKHRRLGIVGSFSQWITLSRRYFEVLLKDKINLFILIAQAPIIALLTYFVMGPDKPRDFAYFVLAIVSMWFGTSVAAREFIRERPVYRRERMVNLGIFPYLGSKLLVLSLIVGIQCLLLFVPLKVLDLTGLMPMPGEMLGVPQLWAMLLTGGVGIATGLFVSALVKSSEMATSLVPLILIPQMLFAGIVGVPTGISKPVSMLMPAAWSFDTMKRFSTLDTLEAEGANPKGKTEGLGLYKHTERENDKIIADARKNLEDYQSSAEKKLRDYDNARNAGLTPSLAKPDELPAMPSAKKLPNDLSNYITFLHPWMNEVLNQLVLMLMFGILVIATLIVLRLQDLR
ncbi:MAG: FHA domain-containing protein [Pyrinomonadaceae bacterium]|nr:FHA domain-containing protein [Pyrinomonadaceae bacterium]MBP6212702.1 FHA domain-containing protein [Pyrinomonadaceae bacterium]